MWTKENIKRRTERYPEIADMTMDEYDHFKNSRGLNLPSKSSVQEHYDSWNVFKLEVFGTKAKLHGSMSENLEGFIENLVEEKVEEYFEEKVPF